MAASAPRYLAGQVAAVSQLLPVRAQRPSARQSSAWRPGGGDCRMRRSTTLKPDKSLLLFCSTQPHRPSIAIRHWHCCVTFCLTHWYILIFCVLWFVRGAKAWVTTHFSLAPARWGTILCGRATATVFRRSEPSRA